jgi:tetratricopeptide (TPR) repeat protein
VNYTEQDLWRLLDEATDLPYGAAQIALLEQVMAHADAMQVEELRFRVRMFLTQSYIYGGERVKSFVTFSWCLAEFDRDPQRYSRYTHTMLWHFKHMIGAMTRFPQIPLQRTYAVLDDMERRWRDGGHSMHAVYAYRHRVASHIGDRDTAEDMFLKWHTAPRDRLSDCIGCDPTGKSVWLSAQGRDDEVIAMAQPVLDGQATCNEQPQSILTALMLPYLRTGRLEEARDAHRRAYRVIRNNLADLGEIAEHIHFCAVTGNEARGLEIIERHLAWLDTPPTPFSAMQFAAESALVLRRLTDSGHGDKTITRPAYGDRAATDLPLSVLVTEFTGLARDIAAQFDVRNGTARQTEHVEEMLTAASIVDYLPLSPTAGRAAVSSPGVPAAAPVAVPDDLSADGLLDLAEDHLRWERATAAISVEDTFDARFASAELTPHQRGRRADLRGRIAVISEDHGIAEIAWTSAMDLFATAGDEVLRQVVRARLGQLLCKTERSEIGLPIIEDATDYLIARGPAGRRCTAYRSLIPVYLNNGRPEDALAALDQAVAHVDTSDDPFAAIRVQVDRAGILGQTGQLDELVPIATAARDASRAAGYRHGIAATGWLLGNVAQTRNQLDTALECYDEALLNAEIPGFRREIRRQRAAMLANTARSREAIDDLAEEVARAIADGDTQLAMTARYHLAKAYVNAERPLDAADLLEEMLVSIPDGDASAESIRHMLSQAYQMLNQPDQAIEQLELISASGVSRGSVALVGEMSEQIAQILDKLDRDSAAALRFGAAMQAYRQADMIHEAVRSGRRAATSHMYAEEMDQAIEALDRVDRVALDLPDDEPRFRWQRAMLFVDGARIVEQSGDVDTAIFRCAPAIGIFTAIGDKSTAAHASLTYGEMLVRADRPAEAEAPLRSALADGPEQLRRRIVPTLARALDALGRPEEATAIRAMLRTDG